jgi:hypothetical protein
MYQRRSLDALFEVELPSPSCRSSTGDSGELDHLAEVLAEVDQVPGGVLAAACAVFDAVRASPNEVSSLTSRSWCCHRASCARWQAPHVPTWRE